MFNFMPQDRSFYNDLEQLTDMMAGTVKQLGRVLERKSDANEDAERIENQRHAAHGLTREILHRLDGAFITPFDREDILELGNDLYRVIERVANTAERIEIYRMGEIHPSLRGQCETVNAMAAQITVAIRQLRSRSLAGARDPLDEVGRLEESARRDRAVFLSQLYQSSNDAFEVMKKREVHDLLMDAIAACDNVGRAIERLLLKNE